MAYFEHEGCTLHYEEYGQGEPLVLLHGLGSSCQDWELQVPVLSRHYRVILMDIRGHGRSDKPRDGYQIATFSADLLALLEHLQTGPVHIVGLSMGGMVAFQFAVDHPQWLRSLCIVNSAPEVKRRTRSDWVWWLKRWGLARLLSVETVGKGLAERLFPKPQQAELRHKMAQRWAQRQACVPQEFRRHRRLGRAGTHRPGSLSYPGDRSRPGLHPDTTERTLRRPDASRQAGGHRRFPARYTPRPTRGLQPDPAAVPCSRFHLSRIFEPMLKKLLLTACSVAFATSVMASDKTPHVLLDTSFGQVEIELNAEKAPISTKNFLEYVDSGFYNNTIFHRVIPGFMVQGGGFTDQMVQKNTRAPITNEAGNGLQNTRGTLSMARTQDPNSATSQFFINVADNDFLNPGRDRGYAVFGKVTKGMEVVDQIVNSPTTIKKGMRDVPADPVYIKSAKRID